MRLTALSLSTLLSTLVIALSSCESGGACECTVTFNGTSKTAKTCGEKLCFEGAAYECTADGSREVASCSTSTGGGSGTSATGGGSAATGGGSGGGGGTISTGGGGGSSGPACSGSFACGSSTCNAASELCNVTFSPPRCVANTTACRSMSSYCIAATGVSNCMGGKRFSCTADSAGGVTAGCQ